MSRIHGGRLFEEEEKRSSLLLDFSSSINPWGPPSALRKKWPSMWQWVSTYPPLDISLFQRWIARIYGFPERAILPCNGATQGIYLLGRLLEGRKATIIEPCFTEYTFAFRMGGKEIEHFFYLGDGEVERSLKSLFDTCPDIIVMGNPPSPFGNPYPESFLKAVWEYALEKELFLVIDEVFQEFMDEETSFSKRIEEYQRLFIVRSLTKYFSIPGLRGGFLLTHPSNVNFLEEHIEPWSVNAVLASALKILSESDLSAFQETTLKNLKKEKEYLEKSWETFSDFTLLYPSRVNFYMFRVLDSESDLYSFFYQRGILIRNLSDFWGLDRSFYRISVRTHSENKRFLEVLGEFVDELRSF